VDREIWSSLHGNMEVIYGLVSEVFYGLVSVGTWKLFTCDWEHMVLHFPHTEGGFGVRFNCVTKDTSLYTTTSRFVS